MALTPCTDLAAADWIAASELATEQHWWQLATCGPTGFEAYARLRFIPDPEFEGQREGDADVSEDHPSDSAQLRTALAVLAGHTSTPDRCYVAFWDGWGEDQFPPEVQRAPLLHVPGRDYYLLRGRSSDLLGENRLGLPDGLGPLHPAFVWPADRAWCVTWDVDPHWACIGASHATMDELIARTNLDLVLTDPGQDQPHYG